MINKKMFLFYLFTLELIKMINIIVDKINICLCSDEATTINQTVF